MTRRDGPSLDTWLDGFMVLAATFLGVTAVIEQSWLQLALVMVVLAIYVPRLVRRARSPSG